MKAVTWDSISSIKKPSKHCTVCLMATSDPGVYHAICRAVKKTLRRKVNKGGRAKRKKSDIKATATTREAKRHFFQQVEGLRFGIDALTLNKRKLYEQFTREKDRVYNFIFIARLVLDQIPFEQADERVQLLVDKSKGKADSADCNSDIVRQLQGRLHPNIPLHIDHVESQKEPALQAADLFAWGVFRKYEKGDAAWFDVFKEKVRYDQPYLTSIKRARLLGSECCGFCPPWRGTSQTPRKDLPLKNAYSIGAQSMA